MKIFQVVVLSKIIPDEEQALSSATGIKLLVDLLQDSQSDQILALASDCIARLAHTRAGEWKDLNVFLFHITNTCTCNFYKPIENGMYYGKPYGRRAVGREGSRYIFRTITRDLLLTDRLT